MNARMAYTVASTCAIIPLEAFTAAVTLVTFCKRTRSRAKMTTSVLGCLMAVPIIVTIRLVALCVDVKTVSS